MGHSNVKLTWDQDDAKRKRKLQEGFKKLNHEDSEAEAEYYKDLIAPPSDEESAKSDQDIDEYRAKLLGGLTEKKKNVDEIDWDNVKSDEFDSEDLDHIEANQNAPEIKFTSGFGEDIGKKLLKQKKDKSAEAKMSEFEKY